MMATWVGGLGIAADTENSLSASETLILRSAHSARLEGWPRVHALCPSFETLASQAPQDEVGEYTHNLERRDPYSVTLKLKDGADATAQQRHPVVMDPGVRRDDWLRGSCLDLGTRFGPAARCARAFARNLCPKRAWGMPGADR